MVTLDLIHGWVMSAYYFGFGVGVAIVKELMR